MARVLIRGFSRLRYPSLSLYLPAISYSCYNPDLPLRHAIVSYFNQCLTRTHLYQIHAQLITSGRLQNPFLASKLLKLSAKFGDLDYTLWAFRSIIFPDIVCFNDVIKAYSTSSVPKKGIAFYFEMLKSGVSPNSFTFPPLIGCAAKVGSACVGEMCHGQAMKTGFDGVLQIHNSLIHMYASCGLFEVALKVFDVMPERDLVSWNSVVDGLVKMGDLKTAHKLFDGMPERNVVSWNIMMTWYLEENNPGCVLKLFREMVRRGITGNDTTMVNVLAACRRAARLKEGASIHGFLVRRLWNLSLIMNTTLIDMYSKCGKVEVARIIFDGLPERNLVCWNTMVLGHCLHGNPKDGLDLFEDMVSSTRTDGEVKDSKNVSLDRRHRMLPDEITYIGVLCACTRTGQLAEGRIYFHQMVNSFGIKPNFAHYWCMANLLTSNGLLQEALETVRKVRDFTVNMSLESAVWANLLASCRFEGDASLAEQVAKTLIELEPQNIMCYTLLLNIYAAVGRWDDVVLVRELIKKRVGGKMPGCSLIDLIEIVHGFRVGDDKRLGMEIVMMMDALAQKPNADQEHPSVLSTECQT